MSKLFRYSESWGKNIKKERYQIVKLLLIKDVKSPRKKKIVFRQFCLTSRIFLVLVLLSASVKRCFVSCMLDFFFLIWFNMSKYQLVWTKQYAFFCIFVVNQGKLFLKVCIGFSWEQGLNVKVIGDIYFLIIFCTPVRQNNYLFSYCLQIVKYVYKQTATSMAF